MPNSSTSARAIAGRALQVADRADREIVEQQQLRLAAAHQDADVVEQFRPRDDVAVRRVLVADEAERAGGVGLDRDALDRRRVLAEQRADRVARLVRGDDALLLRRQLRPLDPLGQRPLDVVGVRRAA